MIGCCMMLSLAPLSQAHPHGNAHPLHVVTSFSVIEDIALIVAGENATVVNLVPRGIDPQTFKPDAATKTALAEGQVLIEIGAGFEPWLDDLLGQGGLRLRRLTLSKRAQTLPIQPYFEAYSRNAAPAEVNPYFWNLPLNGGHMAILIADALSEADPGAAERYEQRAIALAGKLRELDEAYVKEFSALKSEKKESAISILAQDQGMVYLADHFGLKLYLTPLTPDGEDRDLTPSRIGELEKLIKAREIKVMFSPADSKSEALGQLAVSAEIQLGEPLYCKDLSKPKGPASNYEQMLQHNLKTLLTACESAP